NPSIIGRALSLQLKRLIINPYRQITRHCSFVVVVDGLDEGGDNDIQQEMLCAFGYIIHQGSLPVHFFFTGRPEAQIRGVFRAALYGIHRCLAIKPAHKDVKRYLVGEFARIHQDHRETMATVPSSWPRPHGVAKLVRNSSGYFFTPSTAIRFID
ncbi:hypothetical protein B0H14DRAFT_2186475, partial [Mycena olivaceomarginata]